MNNFRCRSLLWCFQKWIKFIIFSISLILLWVQDLSGQHSFWKKQRLMLCLGCAHQIQSTILLNNLCRSVNFSSILLFFRCFLISLLRIEFFLFFCFLRLSRLSVCKIFYWWICILGDLFVQFLFILLTILLIILIRVVNNYFLFIFSSIILLLCFTILDICSGHISATFTAKQLFVCRFGYLRWRVILSCISAKLLYHSIKIDWFKTWFPSFL